MSHTHNRNQYPVASNSLQEECIRVQKVYDWVTDALTVSQTIQFTQDQIRKIEKAMEDPNRRPLRIVAQGPQTGPLFGLHHKHDQSQDDVLCEQVGEKRDVTVPVNGTFANAQLVDLLFTADIKVCVIDRHGVEVASMNCNASVFESFVLCYPDGTDLYCKITKVITKIPTGTVLLNCPAPRSFALEVTFCVDIQVEAEVKLEVLAKFCSPRDNDLVAPDIGDQCPDIVFPQQCPDIFPRQNCDCSATAQASGSSSEGQVGIYAEICPNCSLTDSKFSLSFNDTDTSDGLDDVFFTATEFDQTTLQCVPCDGGLKLMISGVGRNSDGEVLDFNLALLQSRYGNKFHVQLFNQSGVKVFDTEAVDCTTGTINVQDCVTFQDVRYKTAP